MANGDEKNKEEAAEQLDVADKVRECSEKLEACRKERDEYLNGWKRAKADLINYQRDEVKRFEEVIRISATEMIKDFIPVLDNFDLALSVLEKEGKAERGMYMIRTQIEDALKKRGLERMAVSPGATFDPALHESIGEAESSQPPGTIAEEVERGYYLNGRVVRPARVKLSKQKTNN